MEDDQMRWDDELSELGMSLSAGDRERALEQLVAFDAELTRYVRCEERLLFPVLERFTSVSNSATASMRHEHHSLRRLVDELGQTIAQEDPGRSLGLLGALRSVLLLHVAKEAWVLAPLMRPLTAEHTA